MVARLPLPPGAFTSLWRQEALYRESYMTRFPGYYFTGDSGRMDEDGYVFDLGRTDDVINIAGHRLSTTDMEDVLNHHPSVGRL